MNHKKIVVIILVVWTSQLYAQTVCEANFFSFQAEIKYRQKTDLPDAVNLYKSSFRLNLTDVSKVLDAINVSTAIKDTLSTREFLENAVSVGISTSNLMKLWNHMGNGMDLEHLISAVDTTMLINQYRSQLDSLLVNQLSIMVEKDQKYRGEKEFDWESQKRLDSLNWEGLKRIVEKSNRLPYYKELGIDGNDDLETLFIHMDKATIDWFLPHVVYSAQNDNSNLSSVVLYQLDRIGMSEGIIYTISQDLKTIELCERTKMRNGFYCQSLGEWFDEKSQIDFKIYETPIDPKMPIAEVNRIRGLLCLDTIDQKRKRKPWVQSVGIEIFEKLIQE